MDINFGNMATAPVGQRGGAGARDTVKRMWGAGNKKKKLEIRNRSAAGRSRNGTKGAGSIRPINTCVRVKDLFIQKKAPKKSHPPETLSFQVIDPCDTSNPFGDTLSPF